MACQKLYAWNIITCFLNLVQKWTNTYGLHTNVNIAFDLGPNILQSYVEDNVSFILYRLNKLIADTFRSWRNLQEQLEVIKHKILNNFVEPTIPTDPRISDEITKKIEE